MPDAGIDNWEIDESGMLCPECESDDILSKPGAREGRTEFYCQACHTDFWTDAPKAEGVA